jgi:peptide-methionine (S)-S-oxide reductase
VNSFAISEPLFRSAVEAIDSGDREALERLVAAHPHLVRDRIEAGEAYFHRPYLLWFVAENPVRNDTLPANIAAIAAAILAAAKNHSPANLQEQVDGALGLVASGRVVRECGVQLPLIDLLVDAGAVPDAALNAALAHREIEAAERLLARGAALSLLAAVCTGEDAAVARLAPAADADARQLALAGAALYGRAAALSTLLGLGVDATAFSPRGFHPHATALHHAVDSGVLDAVVVLVEAGSGLEIRDRVYDGTPLDWARHLGRTEIAAYLRARSGGH